MTVSGRHTGRYTGRRLRARRTLGLAVAWLLPVVWLAGCSHYHLGPGGGALPFASLYVAPPTNRTKVPQSRAIIGALVRQAFARDGRVELVDRADEADATLEIALTDYHREVAASREDDTGLARKFTLFLTATCRLRNNRTGRILFENRVITAQKESFTDNGLGDVPFGLSNDQLQAEYNELPQLGNALADQVTHAVLDVW